MKIMPKDAAERLLMTALSLYDNITGTRPVFFFLFTVLSIVLQPKQIYSNVTQKGTI